jgi:histidine triad (HIT) family protein
MTLFEQGGNKTVAVSCVFCSIVRGETKSYTVYSGSLVVAFLDSKPLFPGHTLVVPRAHYPTLADLPLVQLKEYFGAVQTLNNAVRIATGAEGTFVAINNTVSQSVPHLHTHVVPRRTHDGLRGFFWPRTTYASESEKVSYQEKIRKAVAELLSENSTKSI